MLKNILLAIGIYAVIVLALFLLQRFIIYKPSQDISNPKNWHVADMQEVYLKTSDDLKLLSWYKPAEKGKITMIYFQGNAGHIGNRGILIRPYLDQGIGVLLVGYRGYGGNPGDPSEAGFYNDAIAAWKFIKAQHIANNCIVIYGESIGSGPAVELASNHKDVAVILQSPPSSLVELGKYHYPIFPINALLKDRYENIKKINKISAPLLILIGGVDTIVPAKLSIILFNQANQPKKMLIYNGIDHNELHHVIQKDILDFLTEYKCD